MISKPMLAVKADLTKIKYPVLVTPKLDGIRCIIQNNQFLSRNFIEIPSIECKVQLKQGLGSTFDLTDDNTYDGEIVVRNGSGEILPFNEISHYVMGENSPLEEGYYYQFICFDKVYKDNLTQPYLKRLDDLKSLNLDNKNFLTLYPKRINNEEELNQYFEECLKDGFEGIIIRSFDSPYKQGRSTLNEGYLLKHKPFEDGEAEIVGFEELQINNNVAEKDNVGKTKRSSAKDGLVGGETLGCFVVKDLKTGNQFKIGTGKPLTKLYRKELWNKRESLIGLIITYQSQKIGELNVPRFPTFKGFRDKKDF